MKYILSHPRLTRSANPLAKRISEITGESIPFFIRTVPANNAKLVIRYGNSSNSAFGDTIYNSPDHIRFAGNKLRLSSLLKEKSFPHVEFDRGQPEKFPIVARDELNRGGGIGIRIIETLEQFESGKPVVNWTPWYNFQFELGVHILGGEITRVFKKVREENLDEEQYPIRNTQRGYKFSLRTDWEAKYPGLKKFVAKLYEIIPIQFARLDVGYDKTSGGFRLIEINSAPDLSQNVNTLEMYAQFLATKI